MTQKQKYKLLIVEDEAPIARALSEKFKHEGFTVLVARDGQQGVELAAEERPDIILLDIIMPVMDGITMLKILRQYKWGKTTPVIILTNLTEGPEGEMAVNQGVFDYLVKSNWSIEEVVKRVKEKLQISK